MDTIARSQHSIHHCHQLIQTVFTCPETLARPALTTLMPLFADDFTMVTTTGAMVDRQQVERMFNDNMGARPGLQITISDVRVVQHQAAQVAIRYTETHARNGSAHTRHALALLTFSGDAVRWHYLQETAVI